MKITKMFLLLFTLTGCNQQDYPDPPEFRAYENNPVLFKGDSLSWENLAVVAPSVVWHDGVCYLFYTGFNQDGPMAVGLATSDDGFHFTKVENNPVLVPDGTGFDSYAIGGTSVIKNDSSWLMIYGATNIAGWGPGPYIGRAVSEKLTGPWMRNDQPVLTTGSKGEWDSYYIFPVSLLTAEDGTYLMYYAGGAGFDILNSGAIGLATSEDGITWKKFDDPSTKEHPFAESDPVLVKGNKGEWDEFEIWTCSVIREGSRFEAYFCGSYLDSKTEHMSIGHAASKDGVHWIKYRGNPILKVEADPFGSLPDAPVIFECAQIIFRDSIFYLYYDYGGITGNIGVATGRR